MHSNKAFTLIEVMVVLSILAIIAILAYNFFGGTMKEAILKQQVTQIRKDFNALQYAYDTYVIKNGDGPTGNGNFDGTTTSFRDAGGYLKSIPNPPTGLASNDAYWWTDRYDDFWGDGIHEDAVSLNFIPDDVCELYNDMYTEIGPVVFDNQADKGGGGTGYPTTGTSWGVKWATADIDKCEVIWVFTGNE